MAIKVTDNPVGMRKIENIQKIGFRKIAAIGGTVYAEGCMDRHVVYVKMNDGEMAYEPCIESLESALESYINGKSTSGLEKIFERGESMALCLQKREEVVIVFDFV